MVVIFTDSVLDVRRVRAYRIATELRRSGVTVEVIDYLSQWNFNDLLKELDCLTLEWVGFHSVFCSPVDLEERCRITNLSEDNERQLLDYLKTRGVSIVVGGSSADIIKEYFSGLITIEGFADAAIHYVHMHITLGSRLEYRSYNGNKVVNANLHYKVSDMTNLRTDYSPSDFVTDVKEAVLPVEISRGCAFKCKFCNYPNQLMPMSQSMRSRRDLSAEIYQNIAMGVKKFMFVDSTFNDSVQKMQIMKDIQLSAPDRFVFWAFGRVDLLANHPEMIDLMKQIGWNSISLGIETMDRISAAAIGKGKDPQILKRTLLRMRNKFPEQNIVCHMIYGLPFSSDEAFMDGVNWLLSAGIPNQLMVSHLGILNPDNKMYASEISANPTKFGYEVTDSTCITLKWKNSWCSYEEARTRSTEIQKVIDKELTAPGMILDDGLSSIARKEKCNKYIQLKLAYFQNLPR